MKTPSLSRNEMAEMIGNITEDGIKYHLNKLKQDGKIKLVGVDKAGIGL